MENTALISNPLPPAELVDNPTRLTVPVEVVPAVVAESVALASKRAAEMVVDSPKAYAEAGELFQNAGALATSIDEKSLADARPFREVADQIRADAKPFIAAAKAAKDMIGGKMMTYKRQIEEEQARQRREAELQRQREEAEKRRLELEAEERRKEATKELKAATTEDQFEAGAAAFKKSIDVAAEAAAVVAPVAAPTPPAPKLVAKGVKTRREAVIDSIDKAKLNVTYLTLDEKKIKAHILDGTITTETPGVRFHIVETLSR